MIVIQYLIQALQAIILLAQAGQDVVSLAEQTIGKLKHYLDTGEPPTEVEMKALDALIAQQSQALKDAAEP